MKMKLAGLLISAVLGFAGVPITRSAAAAGAVYCIQNAHTGGYLSDVGNKLSDRCLVVQKTPETQQTRYSQQN